MNYLSLAERAVYDLPVNPSGTMVLQWHITERCNLRCAHCYQEQYDTSELTLEELCLVIDQFKFLLAELKRKECAKLQGLVNVTGGEPFLRKDFFTLLEHFRSNQADFSFGILSNGTLIDHEVARQLRKMNTAYVQISLDGARETNDSIRGEGSFNRAVEALQHLAAHGVKTSISFTAHRDNFHEFLDVARIAFDLRVNRIWADRMIPCGSGMTLEEQILTPTETRDFFEIMNVAHSESQGRFCQTEVFMGRALQFLIGGGEPYRCLAGDRLVALQANGDVYPCRRMPIRVGNVLETPLADLYEQNALFQKLRRHEISVGCESCSFRRKCQGGLKCLADAVHGDPFRADPGCWRAVEEQVPAKMT